MIYPRVLARRLLKRDRTLQREIHRDLRLHRNRRAILHIGLVTPLLHRVDGCGNEHGVPAHRADALYCPVFRNICIEHHNALNVRLARKLRIGRSNFRDEQPFGHFCRQPDPAFEIPSGPAAGNSGFVSDLDAAAGWDESGCEAARFGVDALSGAEGAIIFLPANTTPTSNRIPAAIRAGTRVFFLVGAFADGTAWAATPGGATAAFARAEVRTGAESPFTRRRNSSRCLGDSISSATLA